MVSVMNANVLGEYLRPSSCWSFDVVGASIAYWYDALSMHYCLSTVPLLKSYLMSPIDIMLSDWNHALLFMYGYSLPHYSAAANYVPLCLLCTILTPLFENLGTLIYCTVFRTWNLAAALGAYVLWMIKPMGKIGYCIWLFTWSPIWLIISSCSCYNIHNLCFALWCQYLIYHVMLHHTYLVCPCHNINALNASSEHIMLWCAPFCDM